LFTSLIALLLAACSGAGYLARGDTPALRYATEQRPVAGCANEEVAFDCDRRAILAMLGEYEVRFRFDETVVLAPGYERKPAKRSGGFETVVLIEDTGTQISMQHLLQSESGHVIKHWRQDWVHEMPSHWRYVGAQRFEPYTRAATAVEGTWTQLVYEVDDAPRYAGSGRWNHRYGVSTWTSERSWRPLPRREYTTRSDYQLINAENRHTITPQGWTHEQDNTKVLRRDGRDIPLVREVGFNDYRRIRGFDFSPALAYWNETSAFWAKVRARWNERLARPQALTLDFPTGDEGLISSVLTAADAFRAARDHRSSAAALDDAFQRFVDADAAARAPVAAN
jgi:hypothetical protein